MLMLGLNETMDQLAMAGSVCWYGHVLWREDGHVLRRAFDFWAVSRRKNRLTWMKQVEDECGR